MRPHSLLGRLALPVAMTGLTALGAAAPAHAEPDPGVPQQVVISAPDRVVTTDGRVKSVPFEVVNRGRAAAEGLVVEYDGADSRIDPSVGFTAPAGCGAGSCAVGDLAPGADRSYRFTVDPTEDLPALGSSFVISVRDGAGRSLSSVTITVVGAVQGVDLEVAGIDDIKLAPGRSAPIPVAVRNNGNKAVASIAVGFAGYPYDVTFPVKYRNCARVPEIYGMVCLFEQAIAPGQVFTVDRSTPLTVEATIDALSPVSHELVMFALNGDELELGAAAVAKKAANSRSGELMKLAPPEGDLNEWDDYTSFAVDIAGNNADLVAIGGTFAGEVGETRTIKVGFRNDGPAVTRPAEPEGYYLTAKVHTPSGTKLIDVDDNCVVNADGEPSWGQGGQVSGHDYVCVAPRRLVKGEEILFSFTAQIENGLNEEEGVLTVNGGADDPDTGNNTAKILVKVPGDGGSGGGLPVTGAPAGLLAGGGALLLIGGVIAFVLARRRRIVTVAE
ncbi:hypothetical protein [Actinoplanes sp. NPDC049118]|uniref:hypothetical protein n=1 Tax=Actinoplanes sp. NPDC049118 TaxID=3155769 RepID=UPI00340AF87D